MTATTLTAPAAPAYPDTPAARPLWLVTLADLALLLVGFFVLIHATERPRAVADAVRARFGGTPAATAAAAAAPLPVMASGILDFAPGSAALSHSPAASLAWAQAAARDPRVAFTVTGSTDGSAADVDPATGSAAVLASDRARALAAAIAPASRRITITTATRPGHRAAMLTLAFAGEQSTEHQP